VWDLEAIGAPSIFKLIRRLLPWQEPGQLCFWGALRTPRGGNGPGVVQIYPGKRFFFSLHGQQEIVTWEVSASIEVVGDTYIQVCSSIHSWNTLARTPHENARKLEICVCIACIPWTTHTHTHTHMPNTIKRSHALAHLPMPTIQVIWPRTHLKIHTIIRLHTEPLPLCECECVDSAPSWCNDIRYILLEVMSLHLMCVHVFVLCVCVKYECASAR
jgi:hypothetical protein